MLSGAKNALADMMLINKATTTTNTPVSGPQLTEIADATRESDEHCKSLIDQIEKRLDKDNVTIKFKCLKIIMHLIENGNTSFASFMADKLSSLKPCLSYSGPADPLRGMEPYTALHTLAQQAITLITSKIDNSYIAQPTRQANALFGGSNKPKIDPKIIPNKEMVGLGSTSYNNDNKKPTEDWTQKARNLGNDGPHSGQPRPTQTPTNVDINTLPSNVGSNAIGKPSYAPPQSLIQKQKAAYQQMAGSANSDGTYERGLVNELCQPGGMRPIPPKDKLVQFTKHAKTLDPLLIGPILLSKLNDENWQVQSKCLYVIENIISLDDNSEYNAYFKDNTDELDYLILNGKPQVQKKANEVKDLLFNIKPEKTEEYDDKEEEEPIIKPIQQSTPQNITTNIENEQEDLFQNMETHSAPPNIKNPPKEAENEDLFGGLSVNNNAPSAPSNPTPEPPQVNQMNKLSDDLLNNLDFGGSSSTSDTFSAFNNVPLPATNPNMMYNMNQYPPEAPPNSYNPGYGVPPPGAPYQNPNVNYQNVSAPNPYGVPPANPYGAPPPNPYGVPQPGYMNPPQPFGQPMPGMYGYPPTQPTQPNYPNMSQIYSGAMNPAFNQVKLPSNYRPPARPVPSQQPQQNTQRPPNPAPKKPDHFSNLLGNF